MGDKKDEVRSDAYSKQMQAQMGSTLTYRHEDGMNFARVTPNLIVGSCLQSPENAEQLVGEGVGVVLCLQEDSDMKHFSIEIGPIQEQAKKVGIIHAREPIRDFDPFSLRQGLPRAVRRLVKELAAAPSGSTGYVHCTAGMGRAPGVALAYMFWVLGMSLEDAYQQLLAVRKCHPQLKAIRAATFDLLSQSDGGATRQVTLTYPGEGVQAVEIAGLDVGWGNRLQLVRGEGGDFALVRDLPLGNYQYKFIVDGDWRTNTALPTIKDGNNTNNLVVVEPDASLGDGTALERYRRLTADGGVPTEEERKLLLKLLGAE